MFRFTAVLGPVAACGNFVSCRERGLLVGGSGLLIAKGGSRCRAAGLGTQTTIVVSPRPKVWTQHLWCMHLIAPRHVGSSCAGIELASHKGQAGGLPTKGATREGSLWILKYLWSKKINLSGRS